MEQLLRFMPISWANALAPNCNLADRFAKQAVSNKENVIIRTDNLWEAGTKFFGAYNPSDLWESWQKGSPNPVPEAKMAIRQTVLEKIRWVIDPQSESKNQCEIELETLERRIHLLAFGVTCIVGSLLAVKLGIALKNRCCKRDLSLPR